MRLSARCVTPAIRSTSFRRPLPPPPLGEVITVAHTKGGAGKTSLTFNLAYALSTCGARVLVIDLDQQTGQSVFLGEADRATHAGVPATPPTSAPCCSVAARSKTR